MPAPRTGLAECFQFERRVRGVSVRAFSPLVLAAGFLVLIAQTLWMSVSVTAAEPVGPTLPGPTTAERAVATMIARAGFEVELVAAEPLVEDPVAMAWGADGKLWVVEMGDYPLGLDGRGKFGGQVRFLEDTDGDGRYDRSTVFLDGLGFPNGVMPWRSGVLVSAAPEIFYAEDTDGDGQERMSADRSTSVSPKATSSTASNGPRLRPRRIGCIAATATAAAASNRSRPAKRSCRQRARRPHPPR